MKFLLILFFILEILSSKKLALLPKNHKFYLRKTTFLHKDGSSIQRLFFIDNDDNPCMAKIEIEKQKFDLSFETGSIFTWVFGEKKICTTCSNLGFYKFFEIYLYLKKKMI